MKRFSTLSAMTAVACLLTGSVSGRLIAGDSAGPAVLESPSRMLPVSESLEDAAFDIYVSPLHIGQAWDTSDAGLMTDVALQLAEGERILFRPRRGITAKQAFDVAVRIATERQDMTTLERIGRYAAMAKDAELTSSITAAQKLASASRDTTHRLMVDPGKIDPEAFGLMHDCLGQIRMAKIAGDVRSLDLIEKEYLPYVPECCRDGMTKCLGEARHTVEGAKPLPAALSERLNRLAAISRPDGLGSAEIEIPSGALDSPSGSDIPSGVSTPNDVTGAY